MPPETTVFDTYSENSNIGICCNFPGMMGTQPNELSPAVVGWKTAADERAKRDDSRRLLTRAVG